MVTKSSPINDFAKRGQAGLTQTGRKGKSATKTRVTEKVILAGLAFAAVFWVFQSIVDVVVFQQADFIQELLTPDLHDIWMRALVICTLIMFGVYARSIIAEHRRTNEALQESTEMAEALLRSASAGIYVVQGRKFEYVNPLFQELTGYTKEDLIGKDSLALVHPEDKELVRQKATENLKSQESPLPYEYRLLKKDGDIMWALEKITSTDYKGNRAAVGSLMDITERRQTEQTLRESEERYRTILDEMQDGYFEVDLRGNYTFFNDSLCRILGYSREEMRGMNYRVYTPEEHVARVYQAFHGVYRTGEPLEGLSWQILQKDGSTRFCEVSASSLRDPEDNTVGFRGIHRDVTERKQAEEALRKSEERYRTVLEEMQDSYFEVDLGGHITFTNDSICQNLRLSTEKLMGASYETFTAEKDIQAVYKAFNKVYQTGQPTKDFSWEVVRGDGSTGFAEAAILPLRNQDGDIVGFRGIGRDITERKQMEEEREALLADLKRANQKLDRSNKELQDFVYVASHDLQEPLRKISSFGELLQDSLQGKLDEDEQENFAFMTDGAHRMQKMIDDLLTYSRVTTKARPFEQVDLNQVIDNLKELELAFRLDETGGTITTPEPLPPVDGDLSQIHQLLQNLIGNGLKFHRAEVPPEITVRGRRIENGMVRIEVQDNGIGIAEEYQAQVFTMFKRLHSRQQYEGTGIGLAVCKKIANRHGGDITVKSTPGHGSTFSLTLPRGDHAGGN